MNKKSKFSRGVGYFCLVSLIGGVAVAACSDSESTTPATDAGSDAATNDSSTPTDSGTNPDTKTGGTLRVNATYTGGGTFPFATIAVFPGDAPPIAFQAFPNPTFPGTFDLSGLPAGNYDFTMKLTDTDQPRPPLPTEPVSQPEFVPFTITGDGQITTVDVTLAVPPPDDGGTDASTD